MKGYPFVRYACALAAGIALYVYLPNWFQLPGVCLVVGASLLSWGFIHLARQRIKPPQVSQGLGGLLLLLAMGWGITYQHTASTRPDAILHLPDTLQAYEGIVAAQPEERAKTFRVELSLRRGRYADSTTAAPTWRAVSGRVIVYLDKAGQAMPRYGEIWLVNGPPRIIDPPLNPGEFNYKRYLSFRNIYHQQYLRPYQRQIIGMDPPSRLVNTAIIVNCWADSVFTHQLGNRAEYGLVNAMILGVRDDLDTDLYRAYSAAGAVHVLSVSGLHVGILFAVLSVLLKGLAKRKRGKYVVATLQLAILWFYALITGFSPPVLRSAAMFTMVILANTFGRQQQLLNSLGGSTFFILCFDPYALFSAGFQLSVMAVAAIGAWQSPVYQSITFSKVWMNRLWNMTAVALVAQLITFPLGVYYFHQFPTYFLLANPIVLGLSEGLLPLAMTTLAFSWVPYLSDGLGWLLQKVTWLLNYAVMQTSQLPGAAWDGLWLSLSELLLVYGIIWSVTTALRTRRVVYVWVSCLVTALLAGMLMLDNYEQVHQQRLAVHFLPHRTAVSLTAGHESTLITDLLPDDTRSYDFYLRNTFGQWGTTTVVRRQLNRSDNQLVSTHPMAAYYAAKDYGLWVWKGKVFLLVNRLSDRHRWRIPTVVDYVIIRRNALRDWSQLNGRLVARHILFDDSNKTALTDQLLAEASQKGIRCHSVRQLGAYLAEL